VSTEPPPAGPIELLLPPLGRGVVLGAFALSLGVGLGASRGVSAMVQAQIGAHPVVEAAVDRARGAPAVLRVTGAGPGLAGWASGTATLRGGMARADGVFPIAGPAGAGELRLRGAERGGEVRIDQLEFRPPGGPPVDLLAGDPAAWVAADRGAGRGLSPGRPGPAAGGAAAP
jgi:hypothetical protein